MKPARSSSAISSRIFGGTVISDLVPSHNNVYLGPCKNTTWQFLSAYHARPATPLYSRSSRVCGLVVAEGAFARRFTRIGISRLLRRCHSEFGRGRIHQSGPGYSLESPRLRRQSPSKRSSTVPSDPHRPRLPGEIGTSATAPRRTNSAHRRGPSRSPETNHRVSVRTASVEMRRPVSPCSASTHRACSRSRRSKRATHAPVSSRRSATVAKVGEEVFAMAGPEV